MSFGPPERNHLMNDTSIKRGGIIIPAKAMPRPLSLSGWVLILRSAKIPNTKATGEVKKKGGVAKRCRVTGNEGASNPQTREAIARRS